MGRVGGEETSRVSRRILKNCLLDCFVGTGKELAAVVDINNKNKILCGMFTFFLHTLIISVVSFGTL